jgi:PiT family inorganic phosphate transporter
MIGDLSLLLIAVVVIALIFDYTNGFHDAANAIATSIGTRALTPRVALAMAAVLNVLGGILYEPKVASTIQQIVTPDVASEALVLAALLGAIVWNLLTWYFGIPSSSSHALIGGLVGAALAASASTDSVQWMKVWEKVILPTMVSPITGLIAAALVTSVLYRMVHGPSSWFEAIIVYGLSAAMLTAFFAFIGNLVIGEALHALEIATIPWQVFAVIGFFPSVWYIHKVTRRGPAVVNGSFRLLQTLSAAFMALEHGHNDAQKTMGIITLALIGGHALPEGAGVPLWVKLSCAAVIGLGTFSGGMRIIKTMGMKLVKLEPIDGFAAETVAASVIQIAGRWGMPISTTHAITAAITGVGATKRLSAVKWGVTLQILFAWVVTLPAAAAIAAVSMLVLQAIT